jgi:methylthioribose-1-phosphate isomerase
MSSRADSGLAFMLQFENVANYKDGEVHILDRRVYPAKIEFVRCKTYQEVAQAITDMVTQSGGPWLAASLGMVQAANLVKDMSREKAREELQKAAYVLTHARPTTSERMVAHVNQVLAITEKALEGGLDPVEATHDFVMRVLSARYNRSREVGTHLANLLPNECTILTQCFAETLIGFALLVAQEKGKKVSLICPETRPYLQGARLTASVAYDQGVPVTVITDNMPGYILSKGMAQVFISAADVITLDGHVVNKIGTFQIAMAAHYHNVPYYVLGSPSVNNPTIDTVTIEERNGEEVVHAMGIRTAKEGVSGYYPAFDITPPKLVSGVVTHEGVFSPYDLFAHFANSKVADN